MKYQELSEHQYMERLRLVIAGAEGLHEKAQDVKDGKATIGWGYTFNRNNNVDIWRRSGIELPEEDWMLLADIDRAPATARTPLGLRFSTRLDAADADRLLHASLAEFERPADRLRMPLSDERIALTSVAYNRGPGALMGPRGGKEHPVMAAIRDGDRAEAWYQLRYNCWGTRVEAEGGLRKRRFAEAQVFGLYDDPTNVSADEARNVIAMFNRHKAEIDRVEDRFGDSLDAPPAKPNRIAQANRDYPELTALYGRVPTLEAALAPAQRAFGQSASIDADSEPPHVRAHAHAEIGGPAVHSRVATGSTSSGKRGEGAADPLLQQSQDAVRRLDGLLGRTYDDASDRMAASLAQLARANGFTRIDHVVLNTATASLQKGENVFVVQGGLTDATNRVAHMKTQDAIAAPVEQSLERLAAMSPAHASQTHTHEMDVQARQAAHRLTG